MVGQYRCVFLWYTLWRICSIILRFSYCHFYKFYIVFKTFEVMKSFFRSVGFLGPLYFPTIRSFHSALYSFPFFWYRFLLGAFLYVPYTVFLFHLHQPWEDSICFHVVEIGLWSCEEIYTSSTFSRPFGSQTSSFLVWDLFTF